MDDQTNDINPHLHNLLFSLYNSGRMRMEALSKITKPSHAEKERTLVPQRILEILFAKMDPQLNQTERNLMLNLLKDLGSDLKSAVEHQKVVLKTHQLYRLVSHIFEGETKINIGTCSLMIVMGDLIQMPVEVVVSPDNTKLLMDKGIPSIMRLWGGEKIREEAQKAVGVTVGSVVVTLAGELPFKYIFHAVIMEPRKETTRTNIESAIDNIFKRIDELGVKTIAFPVFGTVNVKFPYDICAKIMLESIIKSIQKRPKSSLEKIIISLYNHEAYQSFVEQFNLLNEIYGFPIEKDMA